MPNRLQHRVFALALLALLAPAQDRPDFGPDGFAGISEAQRRELLRGKIIYPERVALSAEGKRMVEAALIFEQPAGTVWNLLSRTEDQAKYLDEVKKAVLLARSPSEDSLEIHTKILTKTIVYRLVHRFDERGLYFRWSLDSSFKSDMRELEGFWRFYSLAEGRTLARYGSRFSLRFGVPEFIVRSLTKKNLPKALRAVKKYVDSGGTWEKARD